MSSLFVVQETAAELGRRHPGARVAEPAATKRDAIAAIYRALDAPGWAAPNLDALVDVLRDLGWLPDAAIGLIWPIGTLPAPDRERITAALRQGVAESPRDLTVYVADPAVPAQPT